MGLGDCCAPNGIPRVPGSAALFWIKFGIVAFEDQAGASGKCWLSVGGSFRTISLYMAAMRVGDKPCCGGLPLSSSTALDSPEF